MKEISVTDLLNKIELHRKYLEHKPGGVKAVFKEVCIKNIRFYGALLSQTTFYHCEFEGCYFDKTDSLDNTEFHYCLFKKCTIDNIWFKNTIWRGCLFQYSKIRSCNFNSGMFEMTRFGMGCNLMDNKLDDVYCTDESLKETRTKNQTIRFAPALVNVLRQYRADKYFEGAFDPTVDYE